MLKDDFGQVCLNMYLLWLQYEVNADTVVCWIMINDINPLNRNTHRPRLLFLKRTKVKLVYIVNKSEVMK